MFILTPTAKIKLFVGTGVGEGVTAVGMDLREGEGGAIFWKGEEDGVIRMPTPSLGSFSLPTERGRGKAEEVVVAEAEADKEEGGEKDGDDVDEGVGDDVMNAVNVKNTVDTGDRVAANAVSELSLIHISEPTRPY